MNITKLPRVSHGNSQRLPGGWDEVGMQRGDRKGKEEFSDVGEHACYCDVVEQAGSSEFTTHALHSRHMNAHVHSFFTTHEKLTKL